MPALLTLLALALACAAPIAALLVVPARGPAPRRAWGATALCVSALAAAALSGTTSLLDLTAVVGVVLVGGIAGAGWAPPAKRALLVVGLLCLAAAAIARFLAFFEVAPVGEAVTQAVGGVSFVGHRTGVWPCCLSGRNRCHSPRCEGPRAAPARGALRPCLRAAPRLGHRGGPGDRRAPGLAVARRVHRVYRFAARARTLDLELRTVWGDPGVARDALPRTGGV